MHIVLDARKINDGGIGTYIRNLANGLRSQPGNKISLIARPDDVVGLSDGIEVIEDYSQPYSFGEYFAMPLRLREQIAGADIFHSPHFTLPYFLTAPSVVTIHDTILLSHPRKKRDGMIAKLLIASAIKRADRVITVSETSREKLVALFPAVADKIRVVYNAPHKIAPDAVDDVPVGSRYFLFIGGERRHKGFGRLLDAWLLLAERMGERCPKLVVVGSEFEISKAIVRARAMEEWITFKGNVADSKLGTLLREAEYLLMPSLEEGFGLPVLEALAHGTPVICSDIPVFRELFSEGTIFVSDATGAGFAAAIESSLDDLELRKKLGVAGQKHVERFSGGKSIADTMAIYRECLS